MSQTKGHTTSITLSVLHLEESCSLQVMSIPFAATNEAVENPINTGSLWLGQLEAPFVGVWIDLLIALVKATAIVSLLSEVAWQFCKSKHNLAFLVQGHVFCFRHSAPFHGRRIFSGFCQ